MSPGVRDMIVGMCSVLQDCDSYTSNRESMLGLLSVEQGKYLRSNIRASEDVCHAAWNTVTDALERKLHSVLLFHVMSLLPF